MIDVGTYSGTVPTVGFMQQIEKATRKQKGLAIDSKSLDNAAYWENECLCLKEKLLEVVRPPNILGSTHKQMAAMSTDRAISQISQNGTLYTRVARYPNEVALACIKLVVCVQTISLL